MDGFDRALAITATLMAIVLIAMVVVTLAASFIAHPVGTVVIVAITVWLFRKIYPYVVSIMEKEGF